MESGFAELLLVHSGTDEVVIYVHTYVKQRVECLGNSQQQVLLMTHVFHFSCARYVTRHSLHICFLHTQVLSYSSP
jgi:hypothetical protein